MKKPINYPVKAIAYHDGMSLGESSEDGDLYEIATIVLPEDDNRVYKIAYHIEERLNGAEEVLGLLEDILEEFGHKDQIILSTERIREMRELLDQ